MYIPELKSLYGILDWHCNQRTDPPGEKVGIFISLPTNLAEQFPSGRGEDISPAHVTLLYVGDVPLHFESKLEDTVKDVCKLFRPFKARMGLPKKFANKDNQTVVHSPVKSKKLHQLNRILKLALLRNLIPVSNKYPEYKPHVTIEYVNEGEAPQHKGLRPTGDWIVDHLWIWGTSEPKLIILGK